MLLFLIFIFFDLNEILKGFEKNSYFVSKFVQRYEIAPNNVLEESGEIIFNFKKGIRFNYNGVEKKSFIIVEDGFYSKEGVGEWNFTKWDVESEEYKFFMLLIKGENQNSENLIINETKNEYVIKSKNPEFKLIINKKNYFPIEFSLKTKDRGLNQIQFMEHKKILKEIMI